MPESRFRSFRRFGISLSGREVALACGHASAVFTWTLRRPRGISPSCSRAQGHRLRRTACIRPAGQPGPAEPPERHDGCSHPAGRQSTKCVRPPPDNGSVPSTFCWCGMRFYRESVPDTGTAIVADPYGARAGAGVGCTSRRLCVQTHRAPLRALMPLLPHRAASGL